MDTIQLLPNQWLEWQVRAFLLSGVILLVAAPIHWRSPLLRHWALVSGTLVLILFPLLQWMLPSFAVPIIPSQIILDPFAGPVEMAIELDQKSIWKSCLFAASLATSAMLVLRYVKALLRQSKKLAETTAPCAELQRHFMCCVNDVGLKPDIQLVLGSSNEAPCTFGWIKPKIVLPRDAALWAQKDLKIVLIHELQHIKRRDWLWQQCTFILLVLYPLNPLIWRIKSTARGLAEESVDKLSLSLGIAPMTYADTLLQQLRLCRQNRSSVAVHMYQRIDIAERVRSLISEPYSWPQINRLHSLQVSLLLLVLAVPLAVVRLDQIPVESWFGELNLSVSWSPDSTETAVDEPLFVDDSQTRVTLIDIPAIPPGYATAGLARVTPEKFEPELPLFSSRETLSSIVIAHEPRPVYLERPPYPGSALRQGREATVEVVFDLNDRGEVINPRILNPGSWRSRQFEQAAIAAISASRYDVDESQGQLYFKKDLTQTYVFELVDDNRQSTSESLVRHPP